MGNIKIVLTTTPSIEGSVIKKYLGLVIAQTVIGVDAITELASSFTDFFGGVSKRYNQELDNLKSIAMEEITKKAQALHADAVVGISFDFDEISGKGKQMLMVTMSGTAVELEHNNSDGASHTEYAFSLSDVWEQQELLSILNRLETGLNVQHLPEILLKLNEIKHPLAPDYLFQCLINQEISFGIDRNSIKEYLLLCDKSISSRALLNYGRFVTEQSNSNDFLKTMILPLIDDLNLGDISFAYSCIQSQNKNTRWFGIGILHCKQSYYSKIDLNILNTILTDYDSLFPIRANIADNGRQILCQCGKKYAPNVLFCPSCLESRYGYLKYGQYEFEALKDKITKLRDALEQLYLNNESVL
ncbi:MAG: YbjQ family protein [Bacillota bacterium]